MNRRKNLKVGDLISSLAHFTSSNIEKDDYGICLSHACGNTYNILMFKTNTVVVFHLDNLEKAD